MTDLQFFHQLFGDLDISEVINKIAQKGATTVPDFLLPNTRQKLLAELSQLHLIKQEETSGKYKVIQHFSSIGRFGPQSMFSVVGSGLSSFLNEKFSSFSPSPISEPLNFTDLVVQTYKPSEIGISPHRDGKSCINLIALFVLEGNGNFCICDNREKENAIPLRNEPGDLILMRGPGFLNADIQPFHFLSNIKAKRTTFGLRHRKKE